MTDYTLEQLKKGGHTLDQVTRYHLEGRIDDDTYENYLHAWQIGAFRFTQQCHCSECNEAFKALPS